MYLMIDNYDSFVYNLYADDGEIMAISHKTQPIYGVQFHPEAVMTQYGRDILRTFCQIAERRPARCAS